MLLQALEKFRARGLSPGQRTAHAYWQACGDTFIASPDYYAKVEAVLRDSVLPLIPAGSSVLDAGCGSGRYTCLLAGRAATVEAFDLSPTLIAKAAREAREADIHHVRFQVGDIARVERRRGRFDVVSCMGVLSTIVDEPLFLRVARGLCAKVRPGGLLLLRDSLSLLAGGQTVVLENYATRYHFEGGYHGVFAATGLLRERDFPLADFGTCTNGFFLYRRPR